MECQGNKNYDYFSNYVCRFSNYNDKCSGCRIFPYTTASRGRRVAAVSEILRKKKRRISHSDGFITAIVWFSCHVMASIPASFWSYCDLSSLVCGKRIFPLCIAVYISAKRNVQTENSIAEKGVTMNAPPHKRGIIHGGIKKSC
ncbi:MAG: hypothetical protein LBG43_11220 [Treponema sp.]|jgi:hypothetical protein|nr:hypothetical protein [Treponema sp.]